MEITLTKITSSDRQYLRFADKEWSEDGEVIGQKVGFVEVQPEKAEELLAKYTSGEKKRVFGTARDNQGNYEMLVVSPTTVATDGTLVQHEA